MNLFRFVSLCGLFLAPAVWADVKPNPLFSDHMVFQRDSWLPIWGTASPGEEVYVHLKVMTPDGSREEGQPTKADANGNWMVKLGKFPAGTQGVLTIKGPEKKRDPKDKGPSNQFTFKNVAVGEVWIASGQSNMEWPLSRSEKGNEVAKGANHPEIRLLTVPKKAVPEPQTTAEIKWVECTPETVLNFSAVAYYFAREIQKSQKVPVGIIHTSWGGTPAQAWTSKETLEKNSVLKHYVESLENRKKMWDPDKAEKDYQAALEKWKAAAAKAKEEGKQPPRQPIKPTKPGFGSHDAASLYNGMIHPLIPFAFRGAIWYQGESNAGAPIEYRTLYAEMITDWRQKWKNDFPFYCVQLAPFNAGNPDGENWAYLREAQNIASAKVKNAGVAVITDAGDLNDIHPVKKEPCGVRLALLARNQVYGEKIVCSGPIYKELKIDGNKAILSFTSIGSGLVASDGKELTGFTIAGEDKVFHPATAKIEGDTVIVTCDKVTKPVAVRYGWKNFPVVNLANKEGLPASPFRTDDFPTMLK